MSDHNARIVISADAKGVQATTDELVKLGKVDQKNADQFKKHHEERKKQHGESIDLNTRLLHSFSELKDGIIAAFAVERVIEWGKEAIKAFEEAQVASNDLKFSVTNLANGTTEDFNKLTEQSEKLSKSLNTLFSPKEIQQAQSKLLTMKLTVQQTEELMPRMADIAARKGWTLDRVAEVMGRAISEGTAKPLTELGLKFKDTGNIIGNFNKVMESSAKFIGGAADAMNDYANQEKEAANKAELLQEAVGAKLAPAWIAIKNGILGAIESELDFFGTMKDALMGKDVNWTDLAKQYVNALTLGLTGLETTTKQLEEYQKRVATFRGKQITEEIAYQIALRNSGQITNREYLKHLEILSELNHKEVEMAESKQVDLKKLSDKELQDRLEAAKAGELTGFTTSGQGLEATRVQKEIEARKKGGEELKKLRDKQHKEEIEAWKTAQTEAQKIIDEMIKAEQDKVKLEEEMSNLQTKRVEQSMEAELESEKLKLKKKLDAGKLTQEEYDKQTRDLENKNRVAVDRLELDNLKENNKAKRQELKRERDMNLISEEEYQKELLKLQVEEGDKELQLQKDINKSTFDNKKKQEEQVKKMIEGIRDITTQILDGLTATVESSMSALDIQMNRNEQIINTQKLLAEKGLQNDLAFEERRQDELTKKKLEEQKKLRKIKELETFLNSLAKFAEENPHTALAKALGVLAATKVAETIFAEEGGVMSRDRISTGNRRHKSGRDVLIHGEEGEGVIPVNKMNEWGLTDQNRFSAFLRTPFKEKMLPTGRFMPVFNDAQIVAELQELKQAIANKKELSIDWENHDTRIETMIQNGITNRMQVKRKGI